MHSDTIWQFFHPFSLQSFAFFQDMPHDHHAIFTTLQVGHQVLNGLGFLGNCPLDPHQGVNLNLTDEGFVRVPVPPPTDCD